MDTLIDTYRDDDDDEEDEEFARATALGDDVTVAPPPTTNSITDAATTASEPQNGINEQPTVSDDLSEDEVSADDDDDEVKPSKPPDTEDDTERSFKSSKISEDDEDEDPPPKKQKPLSSLTAEPPLIATPPSDQLISEDANLSSHSPLATPVAPAMAAKKSKKKSNNVWTKSASRKGKKKTKANTNSTPSEDTVLITPVPRFPDKSDDSSDMKICLSKVYKAERVELSDDRMCAGSSKGYRMVRATRGVLEGAWYFEIKVVKLGESGHTRLGWSTEKGDLQAPVGYDGNSFGYRDIDGSKIHKALREKYGEGGYVEGDVIGFYINLPEGRLYAPKPPHLVWYKGQKYACAPDVKEDPPKIVPGSEISFFRNGVCQGVAFKDLYGGRYYPAASMYTLPNQPNCTIKFNFGPDFEFFPEDFDGRAVPRPMIEVPYHGFDGKVENGVQ